MRWFGGVVVVLLGLAGCAGESAVSFPSASPAGAAGDRLSANLYLPDGNGPHPAVVLLHGCSGLGRHGEEWGRRLAGWGYVVLNVDSLRPRGYQSVCGKPGDVPPSLRARDAFGAAAYLRGLPAVRGDRIGVIGFSHGGWTVLRAGQPIAAEEVAAPPFRAAVAYYPWCDSASQRNLAIPALVLIGEQDDWTPAARCRALEQALREPALMAMTVYPNAFHSFDFEAPLRFTQGSDGKMHRAEPDREAAADSFARTRAFLDRHLKP